jgi:RHS repeat-associated protein
VTYQYGAAGDLVSIVDASDHAVSFTYDNLSRITTETREMGQVISWTYNDLGLAADKTYPNGNREKYTYNDKNLLISVMYQDEQEQTTDTANFSYNSSSQVSGYANGVISAAVSYDAAMLKSAETIDFDSFTASYAYSYYANGRKKSLQITDGSGATFTCRFSYDNADNLTAVELPGSLADGAGQQTVVYGDYLWKKPQTKILPGGVVVSHEYDPLLRSVGFAVVHPAGNTLLARQYGYDKMGNLLTADGGEDATSYNYDELYQLLQADLPDDVSYGYSYDPAGNRITDTNVDEEWQYDADNRLLSFGNIDLVYDDNGSLTARKVDGAVVLSCFYNEANRLSEVRDGTGTVLARYWYDPYGRRVKKEIGGESIFYLYGDEGLLAEMDETGKITVMYVYKPDSGWMTDPVALVNADNAFFYHNDQLGRPLVLTSPAGDIVWQAEAEPFGRTTVITSAITNNLRLPGQYYDPETGFHYNYQRYYDPETGRYIRLDPIDLRGGLNLYLYAGNNPVSRWDARGESICGGANAFVGAVGGGVGGCTGMCCENGALYNYRKINVKVGFGLGLSGGIGPSVSPFDDFGDCPTDSCVLEEATTLGPFNFSINSTGSGGTAINSELGFDIGAFVSCDKIVGKTFIDCCD